MNEYTIDWLEKKTIAGDKELIEATLAGVGTVTIWKLDKDGKEFPGFNDLMPGGKVTGTIWANPTNSKKTLYPPKPQAPMGQARGAGMAAAQNRKAEHIKEAQERKEESIAYFNATNCAIEMVKARYDLRYGQSGVSEATIQDNIRLWRDFFLKEHQDYKDKPPF